MQLLQFQRRFLREAFRSGIRTAALSLPRGNGKSTLAAYLALRTVTPGDPLHVPGQTVLLVGPALNQVQRTLFRLIRGMLPDPAAFKISDSSNNNCRLVHRDSGAQIVGLAANPKTAQGLVGVPLVIADEPGAWEVNAGTAMHDAIQTAMGKPDSDLQAVYIGTLAPATEGWWHDLVTDGSHDSTHVTARQGDRERWDDANVIRACNPLMWKFAESRKVLLDERDKARADSRLKARFLSYRLNLPSADESVVLLTVQDYELACQRETPETAGRPVVGVDLGGGRSWSAAVGIWPSGRAEAIASAPGVPDIADQERRDRVPPGTYRHLVRQGRLTVAEGLRVQPPARLLDAIRPWRPSLIVCDRFRLAELQDCQPPCPVAPRVTRWSEAAEDIRALRKMALDGPLSIGPESRDLIAYGLSQARVRNDDQGNFRLEKRDPSGRTGRDDVAAAFVLAAGALARGLGRRPAWRYRGAA